MITAARLRERNVARGHLMRSYTSSFGHRFMAGSEGTPSPIRIVDNAAELAELMQVAQFELMEFESVEALEAFIQGEMESRVRSGAVNVRAQIENAPPKPAPVAAPVVRKLTEPTPVGEEPSTDAPTEAAAPTHDAPTKKVAAVPPPVPTPKAGRAGRRTKR